MRTQRATLRSGMRCTLSQLLSIFLIVYSVQFLNSCVMTKTCVFLKVDFAKRNLLRFGALHPDCLLRILVLSDGQDTKSVCAAHKVALEVSAAHITVDAVSIGPESNHALRGLVAATGGLAFKPATLKDALRLCELETLQSLRARPPIQVLTFCASVPPFLRFLISLLASVRSVYR